MVNNINKPIGVFDSGIGGLSVLKQLVRFIPYEKFIYLGDTARVPYGNRSVEIVKEYAKQCTEFLIEKNVKLIIVACNTVSSVALDTVIEAAGTIPVIGMIKPAAGAALRSTVNKKIGIIGTRATISSNSYGNEIVNLADDYKVNVFSQACPLFVPLAEEGMIRHISTKVIAEEYLNSLKEHNIDTLVLGCTHYPLLSQLFNEILPDVNLIDPGEHSAVAALRLLAESGELVEEKSEFLLKPNIEFFVTDVPALFFEQAKNFLGFGIDQPTKISLE